MNKRGSDKKKYYLFDSENFVLGRMSARIAFLLQGKNNPQYTANKVSNIRVVVINSDKIRVTGKKKEAKMYHKFSGYPGGITSRKLGEVLEGDSRRVVRDSVYGMLPKNSLRDIMMKNLLVFKDSKHNTLQDKITEIKG